MNRRMGMGWSKKMKRGISILLSLGLALSILIGAFPAYAEEGGGQITAPLETEQPQETDSPEVPVEPADPTESPDSDIADDVTESDVSDTQDETADEQEPDSADEPEPNLSGGQNESPTQLAMPTEDIVSARTCEAPVAAEQAL